MQFIAPWFSVLCN